jgi:hypothetical protein
VFSLQSWPHVEELKKIARRYLDEHEHSYPKGYDLPSGHWGKAPVTATEGEPRCGVQARADVNLVASGGFDVVTCGRVAEHAGSHLCAAERLIGPVRWRMFHGATVRTQTTMAKCSPSIGTGSFHTGAPAAGLGGNRYA